VTGLRDLGLLVLLEAGMVGLALTQAPFLLYPLALLGAAGVLTLFTAINSMLVLMLTRRDNTVDTWRDALVPLAIGLVVSLMLVGAVDAARYALTGTWEGIPPLQ
jgi:hypothetical protein